MNNSKISVCLFSDPNFLAVNLLENLLSKNCVVNIITDDTKGWQLSTPHLMSRSHFLITNAKEVSENQVFNYSIFCGGFISKGDAYKSYVSFSKLKNLQSQKTLIIFPFEIYSFRDASLMRINDSLSVIYVGDLIGPRINLNSDLLLSQATLEVLEKRELTLGVGERIYPLFISDAVRTLTKWLFSFGPYGKELFLLGPETSGTDYWSANRRLVGEIKLIYNTEIAPRVVPRNFEITTIPTNLKLALTETYTWIGKNYKTAPRAQKDSKPAKIKRVRKYPKFVKPLILFLAVALTLPFVTALVSGGLFFLSYKDFVSGNTDSATGKILFAKTLLGIGGAESRGLNYVPILGAIYRETNFISVVGESFSDIAITSAPLLKTSQAMVSNILGDSVYDPTTPSTEIKEGLQIVYQDISKIQEEADARSNEGVLTAKLLLRKIDLEQIKNYVNQGEKLSGDLPSLLGKDSRKTYLVLFQNNMELRPTGGFIGSFGLLTFDGGRMSDLTVNDVYSADGQLRGHVEPPAPIKNYLNEANWFLRDSNWDPDFPTSARRAEWFLDKEMDQKVDGVFAIDLNLIRDILKVSGPIFLADYNMDITQGNLYEKTQAEAQDQFFPGSHQKASFLTALSRNLIADVEKETPKQKISVVRYLFENLNERHVQAFLHDDSSQAAISALNWSGEVAAPSCGPNCYADLIGLTEANVGVNKSNFFLTREVGLNVNVNQGKVDRQLTVTFKNSANTALGPSGRYKVYIRAFVPKDADGIIAQTITGENVENVPAEIVDEHGYKEVGVLAEVLGGQSKKIEFDWTSPLPPNTASYGLYVRKQAGVTDDPWHLSLTGEGAATYNTVLARDFFSRINF